MNLHPRGTGSKFGSKFASEGFYAPFDVLFREPALVVGDGDLS
jgi:hypothetical protein